MLPGDKNEQENGIELGKMGCISICFKTIRLVLELPIQLE